MFRFGVAFCAVCVGIFAAAADVVVTMPLLPPPDPNAPRGRSPEKDELVYTTIVTFYGITYMTGRLLYRWRGAEAEAYELRSWSQMHMVVLNLAGGCFLVGNGFQGLQMAGVFRPSLAVGLLLLALGATDGWQAVKRWRYFQKE